MTWSLEASLFLAENGFVEANAPEKSSKAMFDYAGKRYKNFAMTFPGKECIWEYREKPVEISSNVWKFGEHALPTAIPLKWDDLQEDLRSQGQFGFAWLNVFHKSSIANCFDRYGLKGWKRQATQSTQHTYLTTKGLSAIIAPHQGENEAWDSWGISFQTDDEQKTDVAIKIMARILDKIDNPRLRFGATYCDISSEKVMAGPFKEFFIGDLPSVTLAPWLCETVAEYVRN